MRRWLYSTPGGQEYGDSLDENVHTYKTGASLGTWAFSCAPANSRRAIENTVDGNKSVGDGDGANPTYLIVNYATSVKFSEQRTLFI